MSRDSGSWRSAWRQTPEPPTPSATSPRPSPDPRGVLVSPCGQLCNARACGAPSPAVAGRPWLLSALVCPRVMCAELLMPSKHPQPRPTWGLASSCPPGHRVERSKPGHQVSFSTCFPGQADGQALLLEQISQWMTLPPQGTLGCVWRHFWWLTTRGSGG